MEAVANLAWRGYPAVALMLLGAVVTVRALRRCHLAWRRPLTGVMHPLGWMTGFRLTIIGLALVGLGAAWLWQLLWLFLLSLAIVGEETLETSIAIAALRAAEQSGAAGRRSAGDRGTRAVKPTAPSPHAP